ncbi:hypothetical protein FACS1894208_07980 [Clostridia bacterium]|nr:hypothetical protein FACS1894208_07980 [Clostridia bacterium]
MNGVQGVVWCRLKTQSTPPEKRIISRFGVVGADYERFITYKIKKSDFLYKSIDGEKTYTNYTDSTKNRLYTGFVGGVVSKNNLHRTTPTTPQAAAVNERYPPAYDGDSNRTHTDAGVYFSPARVKSFQTGA